MVPREQTCLPKEYPADAHGSTCYFLERYTNSKLDNDPKNDFNQIEHIDFTINDAQLFQQI